MKNIKRVNDLTGRRFGRLVVIGLDTSKQTRKTYWICQCDCGRISSHRSDGLLRGAIKSCGCYKNELSTERVVKNHKHKQSGTRLYNIWQGMKDRCNNEHNISYCRYGARGIKVCKEWESDFSNFYSWSVENGYNDNLTIDRINNDGNYCPENCRWSTSEEQSNNRSTNINIRIGNATKTLNEWCEIFELDPSMMYARYQRNGYTGIDDFFNKPKREHRGNQENHLTP